MVGVCMIGRVFKCVHGRARTVKGTSYEPRVL
jgi:hypothetical protein